MEKAYLAYVTIVVIERFNIIVYKIIFAHLK